MLLKDAPMGVGLKISEISANVTSKIKLFSMGLHTDDVIVKLNKSRFFPLLVRNCSCESIKIALGREWSDAIKVELA
ncbi:MAG: FeoA domain-containing protein [Chloroflexota bacterium]